MLNRKLASVRKLYGFNQGAIAKVIGVTVTTFSAKETGKVSFTQKEMVTITNFFKELDPKITMDDIFFVEEVTETVANKKGS